MDEAILARHGESAYSALGLGNGDPSVDVGLTAKGEAQAAALGRALRDQTIDLCVVTGFGRTAATADAALGERARTIPKLVLRELDDITLGAFEGHPIDEYRTWLRAHGARAPVPGGGESRVDVVARYAKGFRTVLARSEREVLCVVHGLPIAYARIAAAGDPLPLTLAGGNIDYATAYRMSREELLRAVEGFDAFVKDPAGTPGSALGAKT